MRRGVNVHRVTRTTKQKGERMTHTPRPWKAEGEFVRDADGRAISYCQSASGKRGIEEVHANAKLEAAAPDLLEALEKILEMVVAAITATAQAVRQPDEGDRPV